MDLSLLTVQGTHSRIRGRSLGTSEKANSIGSSDPEKDSSSILADEASFTSAFNLLGENDSIQISRENSNFSEIQPNKAISDTIANNTFPSPNQGSQLKRQTKEVFAINVRNTENKTLVSLTNNKLIMQTDKVREDTQQDIEPPKSNEMPSKNETKIFNKSSSSTKEGSEFNENRIVPISMIVKLRKTFFKKRVPKNNLTFDAFVDKKRGLQAPEIKSEYPSYKIDKRLIFLGKEPKYPKLIIPYKSYLRKFWNILIMLTIVFEVIWCPLGFSFLYNHELPGEFLALEIILMFVYLLDILINMRTTYMNENNEEIIDPKMLRNSYMKSRLFIVDMLTTIPIGEIMLLILSKKENKYKYYYIFKIIEILRLCKIKKYSQHISVSGVVKILSTFGLFFLLIHLLSCIWYTVIRIQDAQTDEVSRLWFPVTLRTIREDPADLLKFYTEMDIFEQYSYVLVSVCMLMLGSEMVPATILEVYVSMIIGVSGAVFLAYIFGYITFVLSQMDKQSSLYQTKLEELRQKLEINKVPDNLRIKILEYFDYSWQKHRIQQKINDFSELSIPLQRDLAFLQHQETIMKIPLFKELEPVESLNIIQKIKTCVFMPGDRIIREGERGNEMYIIQEGKVEVILKKPGSAEGRNYQSIFLGKGSYFGEIALISNSKRTSDVNAYEFCILDTLSKSDYLSLKSEFPDIGPRLKAGLKHYKNNHMNQLIQIMKKLRIFESFSEEQLKIIIMNYMEEMFLDPDTLVLKPKEKTNSIYIILVGSINCYPNSSQTKAYIKNLKLNGGSNKPNYREFDDEESYLACVDDNVLDLEKDQFSINDQKKKLALIKVYSYGECFGNLKFEINDCECREYYLTESGCQIGVINQTV